MKKFRSNRIYLSDLPTLLIAYFLYNVVLLSCFIIYLDVTIISSGNGVDNKVFIGSTDQVVLNDLDNNGTAKFTDGEKIVKEKPKKGFVHLSLYKQQANKDKPITHLAMYNVFKRILEVEIKFQRPCS